MQLTAIVLAIMAVLVLIFIIKRQILRGTDLVLKLIFVFSMGIALAGLFWQYPFATMADNSLQSIGLLTSFKSLDARINSLNPANIIDGIEDFFSGGNQEEEVLVEAGYFEDEVYTNLLEMLTTIYRGLAVIISLAVMVLIIYLSYATYGASSALKLEKKVDHLEKELAQLRAATQFATN